MNPNEYQLLDFGDHQKIESFSGTVVQRETPSAIGSLRELTEQPSVRFRLGRKSGSWTGQPPANWQVSIDELIFELRTTPTGQIGVFPEQSHNWTWLSNLSLPFADLKAINLFGYTGGTTLALAKLGAQVTHVDAAKSVVNWARKNADLNGLTSAPIRWIVEDAMTFVEREIRRGNKYDIVIADPPSFGRGPSGETWKIQKCFPDLLQRLRELTLGDPKLILVSCHTPEFDTQSLSQLVSKHFQIQRNKLEAFDLTLESTSGKQLPSGTCCRWSSP
jgi:23S rRNA (cytosine1962-C5)-methyltransferase